MKLQRTTDRAVYWFYKLLELAVVICMVAMIFMVFGNAVMRYAFNSGFSVSDEMSRYCFIWLTYAGALVAMHEGEGPRRLTCG
jgi:TRAP-type C4-dicarboxylate transport system permease small subunit